METLIAILVCGVLGALMGLVVGPLIDRLGEFFYRKIVAASLREPEQAVFYCPCGHKDYEHSHCSPIGCLKCDCWRTGGFELKKPPKQKVST